MIRVTVTGSESTGKTTLATRLAQHFGTVWVPEFSRAYAAARGAPLTVTDVEPIARGQIEAEDRIAAGATTLVVLDTDLVSTTVYARHYYGACPPWIDREAECRLANLYLLCDIDTPWTADTIRDRPGERADLHQLFRERLDSLGANVQLIHGAKEERVYIASLAVARLLP
jgi:NadR type nicotinamide-nucleotide adenylyltransferase